MDELPTSWPALQRALFDESEAANWDPEKRNSFGDEIAHLLEEIAEAFRAYRKSHGFEITFDENGKPQGVPVEFADALIGMFYNAELHGFSLMEAVQIKHDYNLRRRYDEEDRQLHYRRKDAPDL